MSLEKIPWIVSLAAFALLFTTTGSPAQSLRNQAREVDVEQLVREGKAEAAHRQAIGAEVEKLFRDDQAQGPPDQMPEVQRRAWEDAHEQRILRMREIVRTERLETIPDLNNAGLLLHHGIAPEDFLAAHVLFMTAALKGSSFAKWGAAASLDRFLG